jgi:restriction endonuclease Mrr
LITGDQKDDWWRLDDHSRPVGPRSELIQEMQDEAGKRLTLATLAAFLDGANQFLETRVSDDTLKEVRDAELAITSYADIDAQASVGVDLLAVGAIDLEGLVFELLVAMGYEADRLPVRANIQADLIVRDSDALVPGDILVEVKRYTRAVPAEVVHRVISEMTSMRISQAIIITTSSFSRQARAVAQKHSIRLIDGRELVQLIRTYLNLRVSLGPDPADDVGDAETDGE